MAHDSVIAKPLNETFKHKALHDFVMATPIHRAPPKLSHYDEPGYAVAGGGTMYGPAAHVNAACSKACAIAEFCVEADEWRVVTKRAIAVGAEVIIPREACVCGATEWE